MKAGLAIVGLIVIVAVAAGAYYVLNGSATHNPTAYSSTSTQYTTTQQSTSIVQHTPPTQPSASSVTSSKATTTIGRNATTTIGSGPYTVNIGRSPSLGTYLTNGTGYALYYFSGDEANSSTSNCNGGCASAWPPFYSAVLNFPQGLSASDFGTIIRSDGTRQLTYNGLPLYYFKEDTRPGQVSGNNVGGFLVASTGSH